MGEDRTDEPRLTVEEAAEALGITEGAVRNRIKRGTLRAEREAGRVYVLLSAGQTAANRGEPTDKPGESIAELALISQMREEISYLREENRRKDHIIAGLVERLPPAIEPPQGPVSSAEASEGTRSPDAGDEEHAASERPQEPRRRSWWREFFGI